MEISPRYLAAVRYAATAHATQVRKKTTAPYLSHLLGVSSLVLEAEGSEMAAIAALLHDAAEDQPLGKRGGEGRLDDIRDEFGVEIADMVRALSDFISTSINEVKDTNSYVERKLAYQKKLTNIDNQGVLLVSVADKLHNARAMETDAAMIGEELWERFRGGKQDIIENFESLLAIYERPQNSSGVHRLAKQLRATVTRLAA